MVLERNYEAAYFLFELFYDAWKSTMVLLGTFDFFVTARQHALHLSLQKLHLALQLHVLCVVYALHLKPQHVNVVVLAHLAELARRRPSLPPPTAAFAHLDVEQQPLVVPRACAPPATLRQFPSHPRSLDFFLILTLFLI